MDYVEAVKKKKSTEGPLTGRMDEDRKLVELAKYVLTDVNNAAIPNAVSVTLNDPAVFAANVESSLGSASEQVNVESESKDLDTAYVEDLIRAGFASANARLIKRGRFQLNPFFDQQMCRRGRGAARCLFWIDTKTGQLITDIMPWDTRFVYYEMGRDGLNWAAYETTRGKDQIKVEYDIDIEEDTTNVLDVWDLTHNEVWIGDEKKVNKTHKHGYTPVAIQLVPMGSMLADADSIAHQGESIFFLIRDLIPELNRLVSTIQSLNQKALDNALLWKSEQGTGATPPTFEDLSTPGKVVSADLHGGAELAPYGEIKRSAYLLHTMIETRIQRGSLSNLDLGVMGNQPWSAVSLIEIGEGRDQVFLPRLGARGLLKQQLAEMFIDQILNLGVGRVEIGTRGHKREFDIGKISGEYDLQFKYFIKSPKIDAARISMAASTGNMIPDKAKRRDILQREDPEEDERQLRWEEAERLSPAIKMNRTIQALVEMAKRGDKHAGFEAEVMAAEMGVNLQQMLAGNIDQTLKPGEEQKPQTMMSVFGKGAGGAPPAKKVAEAAGTLGAEGEPD